MSATLSRRGALASGFTVLFAFAPPALAKPGGGEGGGGPPKVAPDLPGDLAKFPLLDSWIRLDPDGRVTAFTGKAELGTGVRTALTQLVADELDLAIGAVTLITADTARTNDEGVTAGSHTLQDSGTALVNAAANVRVLLVEAAAMRWATDVAALTIADGQVAGPDGRKVSFAELAGSVSLTVRARADVPLRAPGHHRWIGKPVQRVDLPAKVTGGAAYVQDLRLPGMLHARVLRGPAWATALELDAAAIARLPGVGQVVAVGRFRAIVGPREWPLVDALRVASAAAWRSAGPVPPAGELGAVIRAMPGETSRIADRQTSVPADARRLSARYSRPYLMHGSIGPSCAVAQYSDTGGLTVWTHTQGVGPLRKALAELLALPPTKVRCIHVEGAGCYGHNGADDVAADAALVARSLPGRPIRLQWSREQEHGWEPLGPAMVVELEGAIDGAGRIVGWKHDVWSNPHSTRPAAAGDLIAGGEVDREFRPTPPRPIPQPEGGGDRNAIPLYDLPDCTVTSHFLPVMPMRVSALRGLGAHMNVFAIESFVDELASAAGRDPVALRLAHLSDPRATAVIERAAARFDWSGFRARRGVGRGFAFARYKNLAAYCAVAIEAEVFAETRQLVVHRVVAAVDSGEAVNPDGIRNQIEGGIVQSLSWTWLEQVRYDARRRTSFDWSTYPIFRFDDVPRSVVVEVIDRPGLPFLGTGEAAQGPSGAALANAVASATGARLRAMPLATANPA